MQEYYYKALRKDLTAFYDPGFIYKLGFNQEANADKRSLSACGKGLHLAKTVEEARSYCYGSEDYDVYLARAGVILAEDSTKVRCSYMFLDKLLSGRALRLIKKHEATAKRLREEEAEMARGVIYPLCGQDWLDTHLHDYSQKDIDNLKIEVGSGDRRLTYGLSMKAKDRKYALKVVANLT